MGWLLLVAFSVWVFFDARRRKMGPIKWSIGTLLLFIFVFPYYLAVRHLQDGEVREGGKAWNVLRNFALAWTVFMFVMAISALGNLGAGVPVSGDEFEQAGYAIGAAMGIGMIGALWFFPMVGALIVGFFLKKTSIVEKGPTGPLARQGSLAS